MSRAGNFVSEARRAAGRKSILAFAHIYFSRYMKSAPCSFHEEICKALIDLSEKRGHNLAIAAPRGHAKSTIVSLFYAVWSICYAKENCILLFSATRDQAVNLMNDIKKALEDNEELIRDFPEVCHPGKDLYKYQWTQQQIETRNGVKVRAFGYKEESRGFRSGEDRPTLMIFDDIDGEKNTFSPEARSNLLKWFKSAIRWAGDKRTNKIAIGTLLHSESLLSKILNSNDFLTWDRMPIYKAVIEDAKREDLWDRWLKIVFHGERYQGKISRHQFGEENLDFEAIFPLIIEKGYINENGYVNESFSGLDEAFKSKLPELNERQFEKIESLLRFLNQPQDGLKSADNFFYDNKEQLLLGSKVLWEQEYDYYSLMKVKKIEGPIEFNREMQNDPKNPEDCVFNPDKFTYWTDKYQTEADLINNFRDEFEYFGGCDPSMGGGKGKNADYSAIIVLARHIRENIFYVVKADIKRRPPEELIQDIVNCHRMYAFSNFAMEANLFQGLFIHSITKQAAQDGVHTAIQPIHNIVNKEQRIKQLANYITEGWIKFSKEHERLLEQLSDFPMGAHDDGPDALEMVLRSAHNTKPGMKWIDLTNNPKPGLTKYTKDPNQKEYGPQYDPYNDKAKGQEYDDVDDS